MFCGFLRVGSRILAPTVHQSISVCLIHGVRHNANRGIFYVPLKDDEAAVLRYKATGRIIDMLSIRVPKKHQGHGLARLLAEAALTYAIVHDYCIVLTCKYMQKLYRATKNPDLERRVIGPKHILRGPESAHLGLETNCGLSNPKDVTSKS